MPNANDLRNETEGHLSALHGREMQAGELETAPAAPAATSSVTEGWAEQPGAFLEADDEEEHLEAIQECEMEQEQEQDQEHNLRMKRIGDLFLEEFRTERAELGRAGGGHGGQGGGRGGSQGGGRGRGDEDNSGRG